VRIESKSSNSMQFSKHATCTSTFDTACYADYQEREEVVNFFETVIRYVIPPHSNKRNLIVLQRFPSTPNLRFVGRLRHYSLEQNYLPIGQDPGCPQSSDRRRSIPRVQRERVIAL